MGNYFNKCYKFNKDNELFEKLVDNLDDNLDYDTKINYFEKNIKNNKHKEKFNNNKIKIINNLKKKIDTIETNLNYKYEEDKNSSQNNIYTINEQINLIHKDLKSLIENDKILIEKYNELNKYYNDDNDDNDDINNNK